jgi:DnaD/phage-associated family protein
MDCLDDHQFRLWVMLMCLAAESKTRGVVQMAPGVPYPVPALVRILKTTEDNFATALSMFESLEMIEQTSEGIVLLHWLYRQYENPSDRPEQVNERKKRHRERQRNENGTTLERQRNDTDNRLQITDNRSQITDSSSCCSKEVTPPSDAVWFARLTDYWDNNYYIMGPSEREFLSGAVDSGFEYPLIQKALEIGIAQNRRTIRYVDGILRNWEQQGVKTLERWQQVESQKQAERTSRGGGSRGTHRSSTGQSPGRYDEFVERPEE